MSITKMDNNKIVITNETKRETKTFSTLEKWRNGLVKLHSSLSHFPTATKLSLIAFSIKF